VDSLTGIFFLSLFIATFIVLAVTRVEVSKLVRQHHEQKVDFFRAHPIQPGDTVMVGDSLTDGCRWDEVFPGASIKNRGINADTVAGVLKRLDEIIAGQPARVFVLIGTNDLPLYEYRQDSDILSDYRQLLERLRAEVPAARVFVQSLLPRQRHFASRIRRLNAELSRLARETGCAFIDLYPAFSDARGALRRELTNDNLHLLGAGYRIWAGILADYMGKPSGPRG
jgi:lysophospholipase L1-like esterase